MNARIERATEAARRVLARQALTSDVDLPGDVARAVLATEELTIAEPDARTVADLSTRDIGTTITLTGRDWSITGPLRGVSTDTDWITEQTPSDPEPTEVAGRTSTRIQIGPFHAEISNPSAITVQEARP